MRIITKTIEDAQYFSPEAINGNAGKLMGYGKYHNKAVDFTMNKTLYSETILCKIPKWQKPRIISFDWLIGSYDKNGIKKVGVSTLYGTTEFLFSLYLHELIEILQQLGSTETLALWEAFLEKSTEK
jgi:hypothetical protein